MKKNWKKWRLMWRRRRAGFLRRTSCSRNYMKKMTNLISMKSIVGRNLSELKQYHIRLWLTLGNLILRMTSIIGIIMGKNLINITKRLLRPKDQSSWRKTSQLVTSETQPSATIDKSSPISNKNTETNQETENMTIFATPEHQIWAILENEHLIETNKNPNCLMIIIIMKTCNKSRMNKAAWFPSKALKIRFSKSTKR